MNIEKKTMYIDLENVINISRGNQEKLYAYLYQFSVLIPERIQKLNDSLCAEDRSAIRQTLHNMSPQVQFFGVPDVVPPIKRLELEYLTIPMDDLKQIVLTILEQLKKALEEVENIIAKNF